MLTGITRETTGVGCEGKGVYQKKKNNTRDKNKC